MFVLCKASILPCFLSSIVDEYFIICKTPLLSALLLSYYALLKNGLGHPFLIALMNCVTCADCITPLGHLLV